MMERKQGLIFISCGQYWPHEIKLGQDLEATVNDLTPFEGYFAQNQSTLENLSQHILGALNRCCGFVAVLHHRGTVQFPPPGGQHIRGSLWVEQEIAIAAFIQQALKRDMESVVYIQKGIKREGIRDQLLLGAVEFETEAQVLAEFENRIAAGRFRPVPPQQAKDASLRLSYMIITRKPEHHQYQLSVVVKNTGLEAITDYWVEAEVPKLALEPMTIYAGEIKERQTNTHRFFRSNRDNTGKDIYPGDELKTLGISYRMNEELHDDVSLLDQPVRVGFGTPGMPMMIVQRPLRELQEF